MKRKRTLVNGRKGPQAATAREQRFMRRETCVARWNI
jgi:hypothetical protein